MKSTLRRVWQWVRWPLFILGGAYVAVVLYRVWAIGEEEKTQQAVERIHAQKITLADVTGDNLPPVPNKQENDATIEGIDVNNNGVRDDVELAIFEKYPNSARVRAAQLQYAMALQMELTEVFNSETWKAAVWQEARGYFCIDSVADQGVLLNEQDKLFMRYINEVTTLMINTTTRREKRDGIFNQHSTSNGNPSKNYCDIDPMSLLS